MLYNLISNAIKFTPRGGGAAARAGRGAHLVVSVADTGVGIAREDLPRLFREFEQLPQPGGVRPEGTGLACALTAARRAPRRQGRGRERARQGLDLLGLLRLPVVDDGRDSGIAVGM